MWKLYRYVFPNNKVYIGITEQTMKERWKSGYNNYFMNAVNKYGKENIITEILYDGLTKEEAGDLERLYIYIHHSNDNNYGYNITSGGEGRPIYNYIEVVNFFRNNNESFKITKDKFGCSSRTLLNILEVFDYDRKNIVGKICYESYIEAGRNRPVLQYDLKGNFIKVFTTLKEAADNIGLKSTSSIVKVCNNEGSSAGGFFWRYYDNEEIPKKIIIPKIKNHGKAAVCQYDLQGNFIQEFPSIKEANISLGKNPKSSNICTVCQGKRKKAYGYLWKYKEEDF